MKRVLVVPWSTAPTDSARWIAYFGVRGGAGRLVFRPQGSAPHLPGTISGRERAANRHVPTMSNTGPLCRTAVPSGAVTRISYRPTGPVSRVRATGGCRQCRITVDTATIACVPGSIQSIERSAAILRLMARGSGRLGGGGIRPSPGPGPGPTPRDSAHAAARRLRRAGRGERQVPARCGPAPPWYQLP